MMDRYIRKSFCILLLLVLNILATISFAAESENYKVVNGIQIYLGVIPAEIITEHPKEHPEKSMHGGVPPDENSIHLIVALFDNATGKRISDAHVTATIKEDGLTSKAKLLEPMKINGSITYGNYFVLSAHDVYRIDIQINLPNVSQVIKAEFTHEHFPN